LALIWERMRDGWEEQSIRLKRLFQQRRSFEGGLYLPGRRELTGHRPIEDLPWPGRLRVPMIQHDGPAAEIVVEPGRQVETGQLIGRAVQVNAVNVHAPRAGRITCIARADTARAMDVPAVEIDLNDVPDAADTTAPAAIASPASRLSAADLADCADDAGLITSGMPALGLGGQLREAASRGISDVIINALESEPMLTADRRLVAQSFDAIITAGIWVHEALQARRVWLAVDRADRDRAARCRSATQRTPIRVITLRNKYPQAAPVLLARAIVGRETPYGQSTVSAGVLVLEVAVLPALAAAVTHGTPMVDRVVTVTGPAASRPGHYRIAIGTAFADVLRQVGLRRPAAQVIDGGPMTGRVVESLDTVVTKQTSAILLLDRDSVRTPRPGPCVRCGWCHEDCPVGLAPQGLLAIMERGELAGANRLHPHACIDCGLCSYVCPAELPLAQAVADLKRLVPISLSSGTRAVG